MRWSTRTQWDLAQTPWAQQLARLRSAGVHLFDLTASNPTRCGFVYDAESILAPLQDPAALTYRPDPKGLRPAREAVSLYYQHVAALDPDHIFLTTSTSEAYSFLFRLLCDAGDEVLIAQPGYPLFDFLAQLDDVRLVSYPLFYDHGWHLDIEALRPRVTSRTRAIALVHPNNPTGHFTRSTERAAIEAVCRQHGLALIVDEVFLDYQLGADPAAQSFVTGPHPVPTFVLSGLSKVAALPQMKAAWIACFTADLERLEVISDTFLSMSAPIQHALPFWLNQRGAIQGQIKQRVQGNLERLDQLLLRQTLVTRLEVEAGWYAVLRVPGVQPEEEIALDLLLQRAVVVHPGGFFGFSGPGWLVVSLLAPAEDFDAGIVGICKHVEGQT